MIACQKILEEHSVARSTNFTNLTASKDLPVLKAVCQLDKEQVAANCMLESY